MKIFNAIVSITQETEYFLKFESEDENSARELLESVKNDNPNYRILSIEEDLETDPEEFQELLNDLDTATPTVN